MSSESSGSVETLTMAEDQHQGMRVESVHHTVSKLNRHISSVKYLTDSHNLNHNFALSFYIFVRLVCKPCSIEFTHKPHLYYKIVWSPDPQYSTHTTKGL